jgi:hypothetical protein
MTHIKATIGRGIIWTIFGPDNFVVGWFQARPGG